MMTTNAAKTPSIHERRGRYCGYTSASESHPAASISTRMRKAKFLPVMKGKKSDVGTRNGMSVRRNMEARTVQRRVFLSTMGRIIALPVLSFEGLRDAAVVVLESDDIGFVECSVGDLHNYAPFVRGEPMDLALTYAEHFPLAQRYREHFFALADSCGRISLHEQPPFFAVMMVLQAQSLLGLHVDGLKIPFAPL